MDRFLDKVWKSGSCWIWLGCVDGNDRGLFHFEGKMAKASRVSFMLFKGPIPDGLHVLHTCDNGICVNPDHLFLGTHSDNMQDKVRKGRHYKPKPKLLGNDAAKVVQLVHEGKKYEEIAQMFGVSASAVGRCYRRTFIAENSDDLLGELGL